MATRIETCDRCGPGGVSEVTLTVPAVVPQETVYVDVVQTVVPIRVQAAGARLELGPNIMRSLTAGLSVLVIALTFYKLG